MTFKDRKDAGQKLAEELIEYSGKNTIVLALPRGGVPVAAEVANKLNVPLDVLIVRKLGVPLSPEIGFGAIAPGNTIVLDEELINAVNITQKEIDYIKTREEVELARRMKKYRDNREILDLTGNTVILVDDGIATGITVIAAVRFVRKLNPKNVIVATPVGASDSIQRVGLEADKIICLYQPSFFKSVSQWYDEFEQTSDEEVINILNS